MNDPVNWKTYLWKTGGLPDKPGYKLVFPCGCPETSTGEGFTVLFRDLQSLEEHRTLIGYVKLQPHHEAMGPSRTRIPVL
jgi:hypothetical protein